MFEQLLNSHFSKKTLDGLSNKQKNTLVNLHRNKNWFISLKQVFLNPVLISLAICFILLFSIGFSLYHKQPDEDTITKNIHAFTQAEKEMEAVFYQDLSYLDDLP